jgi:hypothetical protein
VRNACPGSIRRLHCRRDSVHISWKAGVEDLTGAWLISNGALMIDQTRYDTLTADDFQRTAICD